MKVTERDLIFEKNVLSSTSWKNYFLAVGGFLLLFLLLTLAMELYLFYLHKGEAWGLPDTLIALLCVFIIIASFARMIKKLPMGVFMLAMPVVPLCMLIIVVTSFPLLHLLEKQLAAFGFKSPKAETGLLHAYQQKPLREQR